MCECDGIMLKNAEVFSLSSYRPKYFFKPREKLVLFWRVCQNTELHLRGKRLHCSPVHTQPTARSLLEKTKQSIKLPAKIKNNKYVEKMFLFRAHAASVPADLWLFSWKCFRSRFESSCRVSRRSVSGWADLGNCCLITFRQNLHHIYNRHSLHLD